MTRRLNDETLRSLGPMYLSNDAKYLFRVATHSHAARVNLQKMYGSSKRLPKSHIIVSGAHKGHVGGMCKKLCKKTEGSGDDKMVYANSDFYNCTGRSYDYDLKKTHYELGYWGCPECRVFYPPNEVTKFEKTGRYRVIKPKCPCCGTPMRNRRKDLATTSATAKAAIDAKRIALTPEEKAEIYGRHISSKELRS